MADARCCAVGWLVPPQNAINSTTAPKIRKEEQAEKSLSPLILLVLWSLGTKSEVAFFGWLSSTKDEAKP